MLRICIQILFHYHDYLVSFKYLLNIVIVQISLSPSSSKDTFWGSQTFSLHQNVKMLMKSCLPMHRTCVVDNGISPNDICDDNIIKNIIVQFYATILFCIVHLCIKNRITYSIFIMYTKCSLLLATCS